MDLKCHRCGKDADINLCLVYDKMRGTCFDIKLEWKDYLCKPCHIALFDSLNEACSYTGVEKFKKSAMVGPTECMY